MVRTYVLTTPGPECYEKTSHLCRLSGKNTLVMRTPCAKARDGNVLGEEGVGRAGMCVCVRLREQGECNPRPARGRLQFLSAMVRNSDFILFTLHTCVNSSVCAHAHVTVHTEVRGHHAGISSLLPLCEWNKRRLSGLATDTWPAEPSQRFLYSK